MKLAITGEYPQDWRTLAAHVKDAAGNKCIRCQTPHNPRIGRCLTVHHFDGCKSNCERWNLMALCQACHLSIQGRVDPRVAILFPPSPWSMPYIVGAYASGICTPPPGFDLSEWMSVYQCNIGDWPAWAVRTIPVRNGEPTNGKEQRNAGSADAD